MSPIQWRQWRRRSDEIRFWRDSIAESPVLASKLEEQDTPAVEEVPEDAVDAADEAPDDTNKDSRETFDFGVLATSMHDQETASIEERMATLEVKLMDLEYAISKIQARPPSPAGPSTENLRPGLQSRNASSGSGNLGTSSPPKTVEQSRASLVESQPLDSTPPSLHETHQDRKTRPLSNAPTIRPPTTMTSVMSEQDKKSQNRNSITSLTIDHYTTLIGLIRREQAARIRLEDQVSDLQRQLMNIQYPSPPQSRSRIPRWKGSPYNVTSSEVIQARSGRSVFEDDDTDTEDGDHDIYETPTERREFEGAIFGGPFEGEAF